MRKAGLDESPIGIKIGRNINNLRYADDITLMAESEEELLDAGEGGECKGRRAPKAGRVRASERERVRRRAGNGPAGGATPRRLASVRGKARRRARAARRASASQAASQLVVAGGYQGQPSRRASGGPSSRTEPPRVSPGKVLPRKRRRRDNGSPGARQALHEADEDTVTDVDFTNMISEEEREELKAELVKLEDEISTLRQVLAAKEKHLVEIKQKLGVNLMNELKQNFSKSWHDMQTTTAYKKTQETLTQAGQKATAAINNVGTAISKKFGDMRYRTWNNFQREIELSPEMKDSLLRCIPDLKSGSMPEKPKRLHIVTSTSTKQSNIFRCPFHDFNRTLFAKKGLQGNLSNICTCPTSIPPTSDIIACFGVGKRNLHWRKEQNERIKHCLPEIYFQIFKPSFLTTLLTNNIWSSCWLGTCEEQVPKNFGKIFFLMISVRIQGKPFNITIVQVFAPTTGAEEAEVYQFYEGLQHLLELTLKKDVLIIMGDWNAKVGSQKITEITGKFDLGVQNEKVRKSTRPLRYDLNHIPDEYTVEVTNRFKELDLIDRVPEELWMEVRNIVQEAATKTIPKKKKCEKAIWLSEDAQQIAEERRQGRKRKIHPIECRIPENS
ncbi:hypothetical protein EYD10_00593, partial [Varanus komodoensis]